MNVLKPPALVVLPWLAMECGFRRMWREVFRRLRLPTGLLLMLAIATPWYLLMERESPGFLQYFIVGEHFQRFLDSGWQGDLYGSGHAHLRGTIWIYWLLSAFPWSLPILIAAFKWLLDGKARKRPDSLQLFLALWMCSPMLMFTLAGNVLPAYVLPGLPAIGMLMLTAFRPRVIARGLPLLLVGPLLMLAMVAEIVDAGPRFSDRQLLSGIAGGEEALYYYQHRPYSAQYYSAGRATTTEDFPPDPHFYLVTRKNARLEAVARYCELRRSNEKRRLYFCRRPDPA